MPVNLTLNNKNLRVPLDLKNRPCGHSRGSEQDDGWITASTVAVSRSVLLRIISLERHHKSAAWARRDYRGAASYGNIRPSRPRDAKAPN